MGVIMSKRARIREKRRLERRRRRIITIGIVAAAAILIAGLLIWPNLAPVGDINQPEGMDYPPTDGVAMGESDAPVTLEDFSDFQCPHCKTFHEDRLGAIIEDYVRSGEVRIVFRNFPILGDGSVAAANAGMCAAEQDLFWPYANILFANQTGDRNRDFTERKLLTFAEAVEADVELFERCFDDYAYEDQVRQDLVRGAEAGFNSTPSFLINGEPLVGVQPYSVFQQTIEAALAEAR
jgi:protein-disulfide isomerase